MKRAKTSLPVGIRVSYVGRKFVLWDLPFVGAAVVVGTTALAGGGTRRIMPAVHVALEK